MTDEVGRVTPLANRPMLTIAEVAELLKVSRQRVGQLATANDTFPPSGMRDRDHGRRWHRAGIEVWAAEFRPGRIDPNPMAGVALALMRHARQTSASLRFRLVDSPMFWLGLWDVAGGRLVAEVLASLGVTRDDLDRTTKRAFVPMGRPHSPTISPQVQRRLERALGRARARGAVEPTDMDVAVVLVADELQGIAEGRPRSPTNLLGGRAGDAVLMALRERGVDPFELRRRLELAEQDPAMIARFERRVLQPMPSRRRRRPPRPPWLPELAKNPLGHDPWKMGGFGSVFFITPDGRGYKVDGYQWFFHIDADGYPVRTLDGRPVGYRWRIGPPPPAADKEVDFEVLPMPPDQVANWPDTDNPWRGQPSDGAS